jgi:hypothetical protein
VIKPTVGRVLWYWDSALTAEHPDGEPLAAIVVRVWSDSLVNLCVFDSSGNPTSRTSVALYQGEGDRPGGSHAEWMPYQLGQAAKTEQLEGLLAITGASDAEDSETATHVDLPAIDRGDAAAYADRLEAHVAMETAAYQFDGVTGSEQSIVIDDTAQTSAQSEQSPPPGAEIFTGAATLDLPAEGSAPV